MNLSPILSAPLGKRERGKRYDCGGGLLLTVAEIAERTGTSPAGIYRRIKKGQRGPELLRGPRTKLYDVGGERLSLRQLCERTGLSESSMYNRIARGWTGRELLLKNTDRRRRGMARSPTQFIAFRLAWEFGESLPTTKEIMRVQPMSHASAMRWRNAMRQALDAARERA